MGEEIVVSRDGEIVGRILLTDLRFQGVPGTADGYWRALLGFEFPREYRIDRREVFDAKQREKGGPDAH